MRRGEAGTLASEGRFNEALIALDEARVAFVEEGRIDEAAHTSLYQANMYEWLGDIDRAAVVLASVRTAMAAKLSAGPPTLAQVELSIEQQVRAMLAGDRSTQGEDALRLRIVAVELITQEARLCRERGDLDAAEKLLLQTVEYHTEEGLTAALNFHLAALAVRRGQGARASALLDTVAADFERGLLRPRRPALRMLQADALLEQGEAGEALAKADDGLEDLRTYPNPELAWKLAWRRGRSLRGLGREREALQALLTGADAADALRQSSLGYRLDTTFLRDKLAMFEAGIDLAAERHDGQAAARLIELVKARALSATLSIPRARRHHRSTEEARFDELSAELDQLDWKAYAKSGMSVEERKVWHALRDERSDLAERMRIADPRWRGLSVPRPFDIGEVAARLARREAAALTLFHRPGRLVAVLLARGSAEVRVKSLSPETEAALATYAANLRTPDPDDELFDLSPGLGVGVSDLIPAELIDGALSSAALVVVPHGVLHLLPWAGLVAPDGRRALEHTPISVLPNLMCLNLLDGTSRVPETAAIIGDADYSGIEERYPPLEHAAAELDQVARLYGRRLIASPLRDAAATEAACRELATASALAGGVLHISAHGTLDADEPMRSGLLFAKQSLLDAGELAQLRLTPDELVLSACSTGWRPQAVDELVLTGDDALGLPAAALEAGARFMLVSICPIDDEAALALTAGYHGERLAGHPPVVALNRTQVQMLAGEHDPSFWITATGYGW
jgi:CHAT domain-containing protein